MGDKLKSFNLKASDLMLLAWSFITLLFLSSVATNALVKHFGTGTLVSLLSAFVMQFLLLGFALGANMRFKFGLFETFLKPLELIKYGLKYFFYGLVAVFGLNFCIQGIAQFLDYNFEIQDAVDLWLNIDGSLEISLGLISTVILAPIVEELVFRGILFRLLLQTKLSNGFARVASSLVFALIHASTFAFFALFLFSYLLCYIYEKYGDLRLCMLVHALFNLLNVALLILVVNLG